MKMIALAVWPPYPGQDTKQVRLCIEFGQGGPAVYTIDGERVCIEDFNAIVAALSIKGTKP